MDRDTVVKFALAFCAVLVVGFESYRLGLSQGGAVEVATAPILSDELRNALVTEVKRTCLAPGEDEIKTGMPATSWQIIAKTTTQIEALKREHKETLDACSRMSGEALENIQTGLQGLEEAGGKRDAVLETLTELLNAIAEQTRAADAALHIPCSGANCTRATAMDRLDYAVIELAGDGSGPLKTLSSVVSELEELEEDLAASVAAGREATNVSTDTLKLVWNELRALLIEAIEVKNSDFTASRTANAVEFEIPLPKGFATCSELTLLTMPELSDSADAPGSTVTQSLSVRLSGSGPCIGAIDTANEFTNFDLSDGRNVHAFLIRRPDKARTLTTRIVE